MKYTTPKFEVEVVETNDVIAASVRDYITNTGDVSKDAYVQSNESAGTMNVVVPDVGTIFADSVNL